MSAPRLSRRAGDGRPAPPVRLVHLGLGNFFRAHQAWYTERASDGAEWGYAAWAGRGDGLARTLDAQGGLYTLVTRGSDGDALEVVSSVGEARPAADHGAWLAALADPRVAAVTLTVTEAGYAPSRIAHDDVGRLQTDLTAPVSTVPGRLVAGLAARRRADAGPLALVPCDNLPGNGDLAIRVVTDLAERVDPALAAWIAGSTAAVTTVVDRITPRASPGDAEEVRRRTGRDDHAVVVTEPFSEWVLSGAFPAGRPAWEHAGARLTDDPTPYEQRKLWLLNGAHSLLAYAGSIRGHLTVPDAMDDGTCRAWVERWWDEASAHLDQPTVEVAAYREALVRRLTNRRMRDPLARIAEDGSHKLPVRVLPVLAAERRAHRLQTGAARILAAWVCHLRGAGAPVHDVRADQLAALASRPLTEAVPAVLSVLDPTAGQDAELRALVVALCEELCGGRR